MMQKTLKKTIQLKIFMHLREITAVLKILIVLTRQCLMRQDTLSRDQIRKNYNASYNFFLANQMTV